MSRAENLGWAVVVGTAADVHQYALDDATAPAVYVLFAQYQWQGYASLVVRSTVLPQTLARPLTEAISPSTQANPCSICSPWANTWPCRSRSRRSHFD